MKSFWTLYKKDLRQIWAPCLVLIVFGIVWNEYSAYADRMLYNNDWQNSFAFQTIAYWREAVAFIFPALLAYQLYLERRSSSAYQTQGLPVSPGMTVISGFMAFCTFGVVFSVIIASIDSGKGVYRLFNLYHSFVVDVYGSDRSMNLVTYYRISFWRNIRHSVGLYAIPFYSGIVCLAAGIMGARRRISRFLYWTGFCGVLFAVFGVFALLDRFKLDWGALFGRNTILLLAVAFTAAGAYLYARHAEV
jgi:hypothetical protein